MGTTVFRELQYFDPCNVALSLASGGPSSAERG